MMKTALISLTAVAALAGVASALSAGEDKVAPPASDFNPIQRWAIGFDEPRGLAEFYLREYNLKAKSQQFKTLSHPTDPNMRVVLVTIEPIKNEAIKGVQFRIGMKRSNTQWEAVEAGMRRKCIRGENANNWTRAVCP